MIDLLMCLVFFLEPYTKLSDVEYQVRERAMQKLVNNWPISRPVILMGMKSEDPEVRQRCIEADKKGAFAVYGKQGAVACGLIAREKNRSKIEWLMKVQPEFVKWSMVDFALKDDTGKTMLALYLILCPFEDNEVDSLPWVPPKIHTKYWQDKELAKALCALVNDTWHFPGEDKIWLSCDPELKSINPRGFLGGLDNVRFWIRNLPDPQGLSMNKQLHDKLKNDWAKSKDKKFKFFPPPIE